MTAVGQKQRTNQTGHSISHFTCNPHLDKNFLQLLYFKECQMKSTLKKYAPPLACLFGSLLFVYYNLHNMLGYLNWKYFHYYREKLNYYITMPSFITFISKRLSWNNPAEEFYFNLHQK